MGKQVKQPQDHQPKQAGPSALDRLREEARKFGGFEEYAERELTITGRLGSVTVTTLNPLDWDAEVLSAISRDDYLTAIAGMCSEADGAAVRRVKPTIGSLMLAFAGVEEDESGEPSLGESQAS